MFGLIVNACGCHSLFFLNIELIENFNFMNIHVDLVLGVSASPVVMHS